MADATFHDRFERFLVTRMRADVAASFTEAQLWALKAAFGGRVLGDEKPVDVRTTVGLPWRRWYLVFLAGPDRRGLAHRALAGGGRQRPWRGAIERVLGAVFVAWLAALLLYLVLPARLVPHL